MKSYESQVDVNNADWVADCIKWRGRVLRGAKRHWCFDWDGLPVDETTSEIDCCTCVFDDNIRPEC